MKTTAIFLWLLMPFICFAFVSRPLLAANKGQLPEPNNTLLTNNCHNTINKEIISQLCSQLPDTLPIGKASRIAISIGKSKLQTLAKQLVPNHNNYKNCYLRLIVDSTTNTSDATIQALQPTTALLHNPAKNKLEWELNAPQQGSSSLKFLLCINQEQCCQEYEIFTSNIFFFPPTAHQLPAGVLWVGILIASSIIASLFIPKKAPQKTVKDTRSDIFIRMQKNAPQQENNALRRALAKHFGNNIHFASNEPAKSAKEQSKLSESKIVLFVLEVEKKNHGHLPTLTESSPILQDVRVAVKMGKTIMPIVFSPNNSFAGAQLPKELQDIIQLSPIVLKNGNPQCIDRLIRQVSSWL